MHTPAPVVTKTLRIEIWRTGSKQSEVHRAGSSRICQRPALSLYPTPEDDQADVNGYRPDIPKGADLTNANMLLPFNSPFVTYLGTNYVPTTPEIVQITELLVGPEIQVANLKAEINHTQSLLDDLNYKMKILQDGIDEHRRLLSPIRRISDDILREIFVRCLPSDHNALMSSSEAPLILGRICGHWRSILFHTSAMWASLHIPIPHFPESHLRLDQRLTIISKFNIDIQQRCDAIREWLRRSGTLPLDISIYSPHASPSLAFPTTPAVPPLPLQAYINLLLPFSYRWRSLQLCLLSGAFGDYLRPLATLVEEEIPILTFLNIYFPRSGRPVEHSVWYQSGIFKRLRRLAVSSHEWDPGLHLFPVNWSQLTYFSCLSCKGFDATACRLLFTRCPMLIECDIDIRPIDLSTVDIWTLSKGIIHMPSLKSLVIRDRARIANDQAQALTLLFETLDAPSLANVAYKTITPASHDCRSPLLALLSRNGKSVRHLSMDIFHITLRDLLECLASVPFVTHFTEDEALYSLSRIQSIPFDIINTFLHLLTPSNNHILYLPNLQYFKIKPRFVYGGHVRRDISDTALSAFIQGRVGPQVPDNIPKLKHVVIDKNYTVVNNILPILQPYVDAGMKLDLTYKPILKIKTPLIQPNEGHRFLKPV
ncbi:hypothetical protein BYT27DRAFT_7248664 [Phlegmacium glaucopus]|nr:hypothetical protein BYT27DRAFT_7248664 [Phlegmacium glaucopus]